MSQDPRFRNKTFSLNSVRAYLTDYSAALHRALDTIGAEPLEAAHELLGVTRRNGGRIFTAGNGGSAAISEHLCCDWQKGTHAPGLKPVQVTALTANTALLTAVANDFGYARSFSYQLELADLSTRDAVVLISSSGNSENILAAAEFAKGRGSKVIGLTGFGGGKLKTLADISLHIPVENYGVVEDAHQSLMHVLAQFLDLSART